MGSRTPCWRKVDDEKRDFWPVGTGAARTKRRHGLLAEDQREKIHPTFGQDNAYATAL